jgi:hypothetical protein
MLHLRIATLLYLTLIPSAAETQAIRISERPVVRIDAQTDSAAEFTRITTAYQLSTGHIAVADARLRVVRVFGPDGRFLRDLGRAGGGPGEFASVALLRPVGDTILVWDGPQQRITRYLSDGRLAGTVRVVAAADARRISVEARLPSGRWLVATSYAPSLMRPGGTYDDSIRVGTIAPSGVGPVAWIGWFPGTTFWVWKPNASADHGETVGVARFAAATRVLVAGDDVVIASGPTNAVLVLDERGQRTSEIRLPGERRPIPESARTSAREAVMADAQSARMRAYAYASFERSAIPAVAPVFDNAVGHTGEVWIELFTPRSSEPARYVVVRRNGSVVGEVRFPPRARLMDVGRDFAWVVVPDDDGTERLEKYAVLR